jgi:hypothetical protein
MPADPWYKRVDVTALGEEARRLILERVKGKLGFEKTLRALGLRGAHYTTTSTGLGLYRITWSTGPSNT